MRRVRLAVAAEAGRAAAERAVGDLMRAFVAHCEPDGVDSRRPTGTATKAIARRPRVRRDGFDAVGTGRHWSTRVRTRRRSVTFSDNTARSCPTRRRGAAADQPNTGGDQTSCSSVCAWDERHCALVAGTRWAAGECRPAIAEAARGARRISGRRLRIRRMLTRTAAPTLPRAHRNRQRPGISPSTRASSDSTFSSALSLRDPRRCEVETGSPRIAHAPARV